MNQLKAPFPWFGGKSRVAHMVWDRFGDVPNYVEPFAGSLAVLLARPSAPRIETVNDLDGFVANFWRAVAVDPGAVAHHADWPVNECDLHARHSWLVRHRDELTDKLMGSPSYYDPMLAGWWAWGVSLWIGGGFASGRGAWVSDGGRLVRRSDLTTAGKGIARKLPHLGDAGKGIARQLPHLGDAGKGIARQLPHLGDAGRNIAEWMRDLSARLRRVRVCCGDWTRIVGESVTTKLGMTAVFLDPPYSEDEHAAEYAHDHSGIASAVCDWARDNGENQLLRIALCGYDGEHDLPGWECVAWKSSGGYGSQGHRERVWFSPHCQRPSQGTLL